VAEEGGEEYGYSVVIEKDAYYSNIGLYFSPKDSPMPTIESDNEAVIYRDLFLRSYIPRDIVLEASINPMSVLGVVLREKTPEFYEDMQFDDDFNLIKSVTYGFDEPYALSLFMGNVVKYGKADISEVGKNIGYMGYLINVGNQHIKDNRLINDVWYDFEWKVKGDRQVAGEKLGWSFRIGARWHEHPEITDIYYVGIRRSHFNINAPVLSWILNSGVNYRIDLDQNDGTLIEQQLFFDKKIPIRAWKVGFDIQLGFIWKQAEKYSGALAGEGVGDEFYVVLRPSISF
jgi:hypothetical protein